MIYITSLDGTKTEPLYHIRAFEMEEILNDTFEIAFDSINTPDNPGHAVIAEEAIVDVNGYKFRVKQLETTRSLKHVVAVNIYFDLSGIWRHDIYGGTRTFEQFIAYVFKDTGWTYEVQGVTGSKLIANFGEDNVVSLADILCATYECERKIMPGKHVIFAPKVGPDNDAQYRYGHNVKALTERIDTTQLYTRIRGIGGSGSDDKDAPKVSVLYISPNEEKYGFIREAEPYENEEYTVAADLLERTRREIIDYPLISIEMDTLELTEKELGERVWLIYEPLDIKIQTRVISRKTMFRGGILVTTSVVLGNAKPLAMTDLLIKQSVEINEGKKQTKSRFEQTNESIKLVVERVGDAEASFEVTADEIRSEVTAQGVKLEGDIATQQSTISQMAGQISLKAETSAVNALGTRVNTVELNIDSVSGSLSSKVSQTDYNGNTIASLINQTASSFSIDASKINMTGFVTVAGLGPGGNVTIDSGRVTGSSFVVGNGTSSTQLTMTAVNGSHSISSNDANGFRISTNGTMSLYSASGIGIYTLGAPLVAQSGFRVDSGITQFNTAVTVNSTLNATSLQVNGFPVATTTYVANMNYVSQSTLNAALAQKESEIVAWANGKFALK